MPESKDFLIRARESLDEARLIAGLPLAKAAARSAYYATFHAAEALIFEWSGKVAKTHSGVLAEFARLTKDGPDINGELRKILGRGYEHKEFADYSTDRFRIVTDATAADMIEAATRFVERVTDLLSTPSASGHA